MIGRLCGTLEEKNPPQVLVDVYGVGYALDVPMSTFYQLPAIGEKIRLHTHFMIREDAQLLFGFASIQERALFSLLIKVSGIGARTALSLLSALSVEELTEALAREDIKKLSTVPGIGQKTAQRLVLELQGKLAALAPIQQTLPELLDPSRDILNALVALGYSQKEAYAALKTLPTQTTVSQGIRLALQSLAAR